ncbi:MAG TPA: hypothetical protein PKV50_08440 [Prolixibacteraceae bacterium]|nr:hypothetical protein [Prolixibacteraceae bacterium]
MKKLRRYILPMALIITTGLLAMSYVFRSPENSVAKEQAVFQIGANDLFSSFETDENAANEKFIGKVIEVSGEVVSTEQTANGQLEVLLMVENPMGGVRCVFETAQQKVIGKLKTGQTVSIKGKCSGMLMEVVLDNCALTGN